MVLDSTLPSRAGCGALFLRVFCGRTVTAAGVPGKRHRRPREQSLVKCKGPFMVTTVKRSHARRVAFCALFGQYSKGGRRQQRGVWST